MSKASITACILIYCSIFVASSIYVMIPLQPRLADEFQTSIQVVSLTSTIFVLAYAFGLLFFGILANRFAYRQLLIIGMASLTLATGMIYFSDSIYILIILRMLQGFLAASFAPVTFAYCFNYFNQSLQPFVIAMINTGFLFAGIFGQMISAFVANLYSYSFVFVVFFCFYFSCLIGLVITLQHSHSKDTQKTEKWYPTILACFRQQSLQKLYSIAFFLLFTIMLFYGALEIYLYKTPLDLPLTLQQIRLISLIGIIPAFFASPLIEKYGAVNVLRFQLGVMVIGFIPVTLSIQMYSLLFASLCMVASTSLTIPMIVLLVGKKAISYKSTAVALYSFLLLTGASVGSTLAASVAFSHVLTLIPCLFVGLFFFAKALY